MNSDEEREIFERFGWQYDYVGRRWRAPDGFSISLDDVVDVSQSPLGERRLCECILRHGRQRVMSDGH